MILRDQNTQWLGRLQSNPRGSLKPFEEGKSLLSKFRSWGKPAPR
jgi:hypothetical protein